MDDDGTVDENIDENQIEDNDKMVGIPIKDFIEKLKLPGQIQEWFDDFNKRPPKFEAFLANPSKNRFRNIVCYDESRVVLCEPGEKPKKQKKGTDDPSYIHASWVDSLEQRNGYILAQAPFSTDTEYDFWRMVVLTKPAIIVCLAAVQGEDNQGKPVAQIRTFWPTTKQKKEFKDITVSGQELENERDHDRLDLVITHKKKKLGTIPFLQYTSWKNDKKLPDNLLEFRASIKMAMARITLDLKKENKKPGPILLCCPSGVHRSGTFAGLDIILDRISAERKVGLAETVAILRTQRAGVFSMFSHYSTVADLVIRHAVSSNIVNPEAIAGHR